MLNRRQAERALIFPKPCRNPLNAILLVVLKSWYDLGKRYDFGSSNTRKLQPQPTSVTQHLNPRHTHDASSQLVDDSVSALPMGFDFSLSISLVQLR